MVQVLVITDEQKGFWKGGENFVVTQMYNETKCLVSKDDKVKGDANNIDNLQKFLVVLPVWSSIRQRRCS